MHTILVLRREGTEGKELFSIPSTAYLFLLPSLIKKEVSCLCLLDISSTFDTIISHNILLQSPETVYLAPFTAWNSRYMALQYYRGPWCTESTDTALLWIQSYLSFHSFSVIAAKTSSQSCPLISGVLQGSVIGPLLFMFILYTTSLSSLI